MVRTSRLGSEAHPQADWARPSSLLSRIAAHELGPVPDSSSWLPQLTFFVNSHVVVDLCGS